jgi:hypothetical protein
MGAGSSPASIGSAADAQFVVSIAPSATEGRLSITERVRSRRLSLTAVLIRQDEPSRMLTLRSFDSLPERHRPLAIRAVSSRGQRSSASTPARQQRRSPTPESSFFSILSIPTHQLQRSPMTGPGLCVRPTQQLRRSTLTGFRINPSRLLRLDSRRCVSSTECAQPSAFSPIPTRQRQRSQPTDRTRLPDSAAAAQHADAVPHHPPFVCSSSTAATSVVDEDEYHRTRRLGVAAVAASRPSGASTPYGLSRLLSLPDLSAVESAALLSVARGAISPFRGQVHRPAATPAAADGHPATNNSTTCLRQRAASPATSGRARYRIFPLELAAVTARLLGSSPCLSSWSAPASLQLAGVTAAPCSQPLGSSTRCGLGRLLSLSDLLAGRVGGAFATAHAMPSETPA